MLHSLELTSRFTIVFIYFIIIPIIWALLLDRKLATHFKITITILFGLSIACVLDYERKIDLFYMLSRFCEVMQNNFHGSEAQCMFLCGILIPSIITILLLLIPKKTEIVQVREESEL